jgi:hypothetical protein
MTHPSPIYVASDDSPHSFGPMADELEVSMLLTPNGHTFYAGEVFGQNELEALESVVLNKFIVFCKNNLPRDYNDHEARVRVYIEIREAFFQVSFLSSFSFFIEVKF